MDVNVTMGHVRPLHENYYSEK